MKRREAEIGEVARIERTGGKTILQQERGANGIGAELDRNGIRRVAEEEAAATGAFVVADEESEGGANDSLGIDLIGESDAGAKLSFLSAIRARSWRLPSLARTMTGLAGLMSVS